MEGNIGGDGSVVSSANSTAVSCYTDIVNLCFSFCTAFLVSVMFAKYILNTCQQFLELPDKKNPSS